MCWLHLLRIQFLAPNLLNENQIQLEAMLLIPTAAEGDFSLHSPTFKLKSVNCRIPPKLLDIK